MTKFSEISTRSADSISIVFLVRILVQTGKTHQKLTRLKTFMSFTLTKSKFIQNIVSGTTAIGVIAGVGLASIPAQAGTFTLTNLNVEDTEFKGQPEAIWQTFPLGFPTGTDQSSTHGVAGIDGWDNPLVGFTGGNILVEYFGKGTSTDTNGFTLDSIQWAGGNPVPPGYTDVKGNEPPDNTFGDKLFEETINVGSGTLDFQFLADLTNGVADEIVFNGKPYDPNSADAHYFATIDGTRDTTSGNVVYMGLSDGDSPNDDDAADFVIRMTAIDVPEPGTILGLLAVGSLGAALKRKKQEG
jgi:PEP-CTERM motif